MNVSDLAALPVYPVADAFPIIPEAELLDLAQDIAVNGLLNPVVLYQGQVLDGRNRIAAASLEVSGITDLPTVEFEGTDPVAFVLSANLRRRHLSKGQLAILGTVLEEHLSKEAAERMRAGVSAESTGTSAAAAAEAVGVSDFAIKQAKALVNNAPDLAAQVKSGSRSLNDAHNELKRRQSPVDNSPKNEIVDAAEALLSRVFDHLSTLEDRLATCRDDERTTVDQILAKIEARIQQARLAAFVPEVI